MLLSDTALKIPQLPMINNRKQPNDPINAANLFWLPAESYYGNFQLKLVNISNYIDEINLLIQDISMLWASELKQFCLSRFRHPRLIEIAIYLIARVSDELIAIIYCLQYLEKEKRYPTRIEIDSLGKLLDKKSKKAMDIGVLKNHFDVLKKIHEISKAYKHSFLNSGTNVVGTEEPRVYALSLNHNSLENCPKFHDYSFREVITGFDQFYLDIIDWLRGFSTRNLQRF